jgi:hypothetical protein
VNLYLDRILLMAKPIPVLPEGCPVQFRTTVHGMIFAGRDKHLQSLVTGESLYLIPDLPDQEEPGVWVHREGGDLLGHLPPEVGFWLGPWLLNGGGVNARAIKIYGSDVPSWRRFLLEIDCLV